MIRWLSIVCVALLAGAATSSADIIHTSTNFILGDVWLPEFEELFDLDLDLDGSIDFSLVASPNHFAGIHPEIQNTYLIHPSPPPNIGGRVTALNIGYIIDSNSGSGTPEEWFGSSNYSTLIRILSTDTAGEFLDHRGFVGLEFESPNGTHYGWLDIEGLSGSSQLRVRGWAYETEPNTGIVAGAIPEPSSLALLLAGAFGIWTLRKKKTANKALHFTVNNAQKKGSADEI